MSATITCNGCGSQAEPCRVGHAYHAPVGWDCCELAGARLDFCGRCLDAMITDRGLELPAGVLRDPGIASQLANMLASPDMIDK